MFGEASAGPFVASGEGRNIVIVTDSFSTKAGGRTASIFLRAKMFADMGYRVHIASLNLRSNYGVTFAKLCKKYSVEGIGFLNPYEFYARSAFSAFDRKTGRGVGKRVTYYPEIGCREEDDDTAQETENLIWDWGEDDDSPESNVPAFSGEGIPEQRVLQDRGGNVYRVQHYKPGTCDVSYVMFYAPGSDSPYLRLDFDGDGKKKFTWLDARKGEPSSFDGEDGFFAYWIARLEDELDHPVFISEWHAIDVPVFLDNRYSERRLCTVAMIHSTFFSWPYSYGSTINEYLGPVLTKIDSYSALVVPTKQEKLHIENYFGYRDYLFNISSPQSMSVKAGAGFEREPFSVAVCCRLVPLKRVDHVVKAMALVLKSLPAAVLHIYGDGPCREKLEALALELGISDRVCFEGFTSKPLEAFARAEVSVLASEYEGMGLTGLESLAVGTPVVAYDFLYGPKDYIDDKRNGRLVPNGDIETLARVIVDVLGDRDRLKTMSDRAKVLNPALLDDSVRASWERLFARISEGEGDSNPVSLRIGKYSLSELAFDDGSFSVIAEIERSDNDDGIRYFLNLNDKRDISVSDRLFFEGEVERVRGSDCVKFDFNGENSIYRDLYRESASFRIQLYARGKSSFLFVRKDEVQVRVS